MMYPACQRALRIERRPTAMRLAVEELAANLPKILMRDWSLQLGGRFNIV
jgi:hypothetical protein